MRSYSKKYPEIIKKVARAEILPGSFAVFAFGKFPAMNNIVQPYRPVPLYDPTLAANTGGRTAPARIKLLEPGANTMLSGFTYKLTDPATVVAASMRDRTDLVIDYEHGSDIRARKGEPSPAAGWIKNLTAEADGIYADVEWTKKAAAMIEAGEYRYISPTFMADKKTDVIMRVLRAGLTNTPALELPALANSLNDPLDKESENMNKKLKLALCQLLGLDPDTTDDAALVTASEKLNGAVLLSADDTKEIGDTLDTKDAITSETILASLKSTDPETNKNPDPAKYVEVGVMKTVQGELGDVKKQLASMQSDLTKGNAETKVDAAIKDGKLIPGQRDWALQLASSSPDSFDKYVEAAPTILEDGQTVTPATAGDGTSKLTGLQKQICSQLGMTEDEYLGTGKKEKKEKKED